MKLKTQLVLDELIDEEFKESELPITLGGLEIKETPPPTALTNLKTMRKLGILHADGILSLIAQAPIDAINLAGTLMEMLPGGWRFSTVDFSMFRVLEQDPKTKQVVAALRVDLLQSDTLMALARNKANHLVEFRSLVFKPGADQTVALRALCNDAIAAGQREAS